MSAPHTVTAFAPATVANVACGFDVFGFALEGPGDLVTARFSGDPGIRILEIIGDGGRLPIDPDRNVAGVVAREILAAAGIDRGVSLSINKGIPLSSGLGGSAASSVAAAWAVDRLLDLRLPAGKLLGFALEGEKVASGSPHPDNAAACLHGGFILVTDSGGDPEVTRLPIPKGLGCAILRPHIEIRTGEARARLADAIHLRDAVRQWGNTAGLVAGLFTEDWDLIRRSLRDFVAEPVRSGSIPGFAAVQRAALDAGALGCSLSGSGPSLFALCRDPKTAERVRDRMSEAFRSHAGDGFDSFTSPVSPAGARQAPEGSAG